jgi:GcrA cell cycle regulator
MQSMNWAREHCEALRDSRQGPVLFRDRGGDQREIKNRLFPQRCDRSRQADGACRSRPAQAAAESQCAAADRIREHHAAWFRPPMPVFEPVEMVKLRCVEIDPRHLSVIDLEPGDCRYPYGGDEEGEAITFCGHPQRQGSSYCRHIFS